jgi:amidohydrolase
MSEVEESEAVVAVRRELHRNPELSGSEAGTARRILRFFEPLEPDRILPSLGGHGVAFVFSGEKPGPTVMLRCELDALPIQETCRLEHSSRTAGVSHKCGHDGHMAILAALGAGLSERRPRRGRAVLLYQPAEETGHGARAVIDDPAFGRIEPDHVLALHNLPGFPLGAVLIRPGTFSCASRGMTVRFRGRTAHAAQPETGISPANSMCRLIDELGDLRSRMNLGDEIAFATVVGARLGARAFGTAPGDAEVMGTLRSETDETMERIVRHAVVAVERLAAADGLQHEITWDDVYPASVNSSDATELIRSAARRRGLELPDVEQPFRWSEDFGHFTARCDGAMFGLGAGEDAAALHDSEYDFADELIGVGATIFREILDDMLG